MLWGLDPCLPFDEDYDDTARKQKFTELYQSRHADRIMEALLSVRHSKGTGREGPLFKSKTYSQVSTSGVRQVLSSSYLVLSSHNSYVIMKGEASPNT